MKKIGRNDPCHCGSGKKYKRCHMNKEEDTIPYQPEIPPQHSIEEIIEKKNSGQILGLLAALQLHPENHGRNFRFEQLCRQVLLKFDPNDGRPLATWDELKMSIEGYNAGKSMEDPLTNAFTETVVFELGNYVVYPGIYSGFAQILSQLIECIFIQKNKLPEAFIKKVRDAIGLLLFMSKDIAEEIGHISHIYEIGNSGNIEFPDYETAMKAVDAVYFSTAYLNKICAKYHYNIDILEDFTVLPGSTEIAEEDPDKNVVNFRPLVRIKDSILVYMPTAIPHSLINFTYETARKNKCLDQLLDSLCKRQFNLSLVVLASTGWKLTDIKLPTNNGKLKLQEAVFQFDNQKFGYVSLIRADTTTEGNSDDTYEVRATEVIQYLSALNPDQPFNVFSLNIVAETSHDFAIPLKKAQVGNQSLTLSYNELLTITSAPEANNLTLWKFAKCFNSTSELTHIISMGGAMDAYAIYRENHGSIFDSDQANPIGGMLMIPVGNSDNLRRELLKYRDEHAVAAFIDRRLGYLKVSRYREYAPIYIEREYSSGFRIVIEGYKMPIWITEPKTKGSKESWGTYICEAIGFWLIKMTEKLSPYLADLRLVQFEIELMIDDQLSKAKEYEIKVVPPEEITIKIEIIAPKIQIQIPFDFIYAVILPDNTADKMLMNAVLNGIVKYIEASNNTIDLNSTIIEEIIENTLRPSNAKMILSSDSSANIKMDDRKLPTLRYLQETDISYVLDNLVSYLPEGYSIPVDIAEKKQKIQLCDDIVSALLSKLTAKLKEFDGKLLLEWLIKLSEKSVQIKEFMEISIPARIACFSDFDTELKRITNGEKDLVSTSLALRILIEFVATKIPVGKKWPNQDDIDELLALTDQVTRWGTLSEAMRHGLDDPKMGLLPSGRIGTDKTVGRESFTPYSVAKNESEIFKNVENFEKNYVPVRKTGTATPTDESNALDRAFLAEFGITLTILSKIIGTLVNEGFAKAEPCVKIKENELLELLSKIEGITKTEIETALDLLTLIERPQLQTPPTGYSSSDIFTWRYNRPLSYLRRPLVKLLSGDGIYYYYGYRHLMRYIDHLIYLLFTSKLPGVKSQQMKSWLAGASGAKGSPFRESVKEWFENNTDLEVIPYEIKMDTKVGKGHFKTDKHYGDVDLLVIDHTNKTIYPIECKNITGGRNIHEMKVELDDYLGREGKDKKAKIQKHVARHNWLDANKSAMNELIPDAENYTVKSFILTADEIPLAYIKGNELPIPIRSFPFLRKYGLSYLADL